MAGVVGNAPDRLQGRAVEPFPADAALISAGKAAVVERRVQGAEEAELLENLRQHRRQAIAASAEDRRLGAEQPAVGVPPAAQLEANRLRGQERQFPLRVFPADDRDLAPVDGLSQRGQRGGFPPGHRLDRLAGDEQAQWPPGGQLVPQRLAQRRRGHQGQIEQLGLGRIGVFTRAVEEVEGRLERLAGGFGVAPAGGLGRGQRVRLEARLVQTAHVAMPSRQQFDQEMADAQGEKIGRKRRLGSRPLGQEVQRGGDDLSAARKVANQPGPGVLGLPEPVRRHERFAAGRDDAKMARRLLRRPGGGEKAGNSPRRRQQERMPQRRSGGKQLAPPPPPTGRWQGLRDWRTEADRSGVGRSSSVGG